MLAGVLLHVIAAPSRVDLAPDAGAGLQIFYGSFEIVNDTAVLGVSDFDNAGFLIARENPSGIVDLAAARWIERRAIENERGARRVSLLADFGFELIKEGVVVVEAVSHRNFI